MYFVSTPLDQLKINESDLSQFRLIRRFQSCLAEIVQQTQLNRSWKDPRRKLQISDYLSLYLFSILNPVIESMRGACAVSHAQRVGAEVCSGPVSLGAFSEAQHLVDEALLAQVFETLKKELPERSGDDALARLKDLQVHLIDSSVWRVCDRLKWALWRPITGGGNSTSDSAVRMHTVFDLNKGVVEQAELTRAKMCERKVWKQLAKPGNLYVGDRYYSYDHSLLEELDKRQIYFLVRLRKTTQWVVQKEHGVDESAKVQGVIYCAEVKLGKDGNGVSAQVIEIATDAEPIRLLSNMSVDNLEAADLASLYKQRWQIECFFHWFKCILKNRHWFCESQRGLQVQVYIALIAAVLLMLFTGKRPNKRSMEMIQFYLNGWVGADELPLLLKRHLK